jgi:hypothetical protein
MNWYSRIINARKTRLRAQIIKADKDRALGVAAMFDRSILVVLEKVLDNK